MRVLMFVGPTKTGTTALWHALHTCGVPLPLHNKETFYFDRYYTGSRTYYCSRVFGGNTDVIVEVSPTYFCSREAPGRIFDMFPSAHIIITLREPISRTISCFQHSGRYRALNLIQALAEDEQVAASRYRRHCARWLSVFGRDNVMVIRQNKDGVFPNEIFPRLASFTDIEILRHVTMGEVRRNGAVKARSRYIARVLNKLNYYFRQNGAAEIVELAKRLGVRRLIYKSAIGNGHVSELEMATLRERLGEEIIFYNMLDEPVTSGETLQQLLESKMNSDIVCTG